MYTQSGAAAHSFMAACVGLVASLLVRGLVCVIRTHLLEISVLMFINRFAYLCSEVRTNPHTSWLLVSVDVHINQGGSLAEVICSVC